MPQEPQNSNDPFPAGASGERYNLFIPAGEREVQEVLDGMYAASEPYDGEFFQQLDRLRRAGERFDSANARLASGDSPSEVGNELMSAEVIWRNARTKLEELALERATARGSALIESAAGLGPFGKPYPEFEHPWASRASGGRDEGMHSRIQEIADGPVANLLPAAWLRASAGHTPIKTDLIEIDPRTVDPRAPREHRTVGGGYSPAGTPYARHQTASPDTAHLEIVTRVHTPESTRTRLVLHEMCHRMEDAVPGLVEHEREHHRERIPGAWDPESGEPLTRFNHDDTTSEASPPFFDEYLKTRYTPDTDAIEAYEILSMSVENLFFGPRPGLPTELSEDPTTERFVLSLLLGSVQP